MVNKVTNKRSGTQHFSVGERSVIIDNSKDTFLAGLIIQGNQVTHDLYLPHPGKTAQEKLADLLDETEYVFTDDPTQTVHQAFEMHSDEIKRQSFILKDQNGRELAAFPTTGLLTRNKPDTVEHVIAANERSHPRHIEDSYDFSPSTIRELQRYCTTLKEAAKDIKEIFPASGPSSHGKGKY